MKTCQNVSAGILKAVVSNGRQHNKRSPTVHAAGDSTVGASDRADRGHDAVMVMFGEAVHQQMLVLCQFPQFQSTCMATVKQNPV